MPKLGSNEKTKRNTVFVNTLNLLIILFLDNYSILGL